MSFISGGNSQLDAQNSNLDLKATGGTVRIQNSAAGAVEISGTTVDIKPTSGLEVQFSPTDSVLSAYNDNTANLPIGSYVSGPTQLPIRYKIVNDEYVTLTWDTISGTVISSTSIALTSLPAEIRPSSGLVLLPCIALSVDGTEYIGMMQIDTLGNVTIYNTVKGGIWASPNHTLVIYQGGCTYSKAY